MSSADKDFRYMATNDLMTELKKETFRLDTPTEAKMVTSVLKLIEDNNGEVQNLVVKWSVSTSFFLFPFFDSSKSTQNNSLPLMVNSISETQLEEVINRLCQHLSAAGKEELRDVASIGEIPLSFFINKTLLHVCLSHIWWKPIVMSGEKIGGDTQIDCCHFSFSFLSFFLS
jgi:hypothetical protein